jgi:hypothetical protein
MRQVATLISSIAIALFPMILLGCGSERQDLGGKATLKVAGDGEGRTYSLYLYVNGNSLGNVGKLQDGETKEFTFDNAKNGKNKLTIVTSPVVGSNERKDFEFSALPGSVTRAHLTIGSFGSPIEAKIATETVGIDPVQEVEEKARQSEEAARKVKAEAELESEFRKFAKEFVPDLQQAIDRYEEQIKQFAEQRIVFAREMTKLGVDPETRPAYGQKKVIIEKMTEDVKQMVTERKETYIRWKELNLLRDTAETKEQRDKLLKNAQKAARSAEETFDRYMKQSLDADAK